MDKITAIGILDYMRMVYVKGIYRQEDVEYAVCKATIALQEMQEMKYCTWRRIDDDMNVWKCSECKAEWNFSADGPKKNNMKFCPECGRKLRTVTHD